MISRLSERLQTCLTVIKAMRRLAKKKDVAQLQVQYSATHEKVFKLNFANDPFPLYFQAKEGKFHVFIEEEMKHDVELQLTTDTFLNIIHGRAKRFNHETGQTEFFPYSFYDAWRYGDVKAYGEQATNACRSAIPLFDDVINDLRDEMDKKREQQNAN